MSSSQSRSGGGERMIHQDYIARVRYSNALPPPPNPPKLLNIPNGGLQFYTSSKFGARLARAQPLNIEVDAELGMPLDLVGMPNVFDVDGNDKEKSIEAPEKTIAIHPKDKFLLRPLSKLGKANVDDTPASFLRRTEYISASISKPKDNIFLKPSIAPRNRPEKRKASPEPDRGTPTWIKRRIEKSFDVAAANLADLTRVKHPSKQNIKVVDAFPLLPDIESFPDSGAYVTIKFATNPVDASNIYDTRLLSGVLKPIERSRAEQDAWDAAFAAHERDPKNNPRPSNMMNYDYYLPPDAETGNRFRAKFDVDNAGRDIPELYNSFYVHDKERVPCFKFSRLRAYETVQETEMDHDTKYDEEVILAYRDDETEERGKVDDSAQKAIYYYPVMQKSTIAVQRNKNIARTHGIIDEDEQHVDELEVTIKDPDAELKAELDKFKNKPKGFLEEEVAEVGDEGSEAGRGDHDQDADGEED